MNEIALIFTPDGTGHAIYSEAIPLDRIGPLHIERATSIEYDNQAQYWRVCDPTGFALFNSPSRQECLVWERQFLQQQEDQSHELQHSPDPTSPGLRTG